MAKILITTDPAEGALAIHRICRICDDAYDRVYGPGPAKILTKKLLKTINNFLMENATCPVCAHTLIRTQRRDPPDNLGFDGFDDIDGNDICEP